MLDERIKRSAKSSTGPKINGTSLPQSNSHSAISSLANNLNNSHNNNNDHDHHDNHAKQPTKETAKRSSIAPNNAKEAPKEAPSSLRVSS